MILRAFFATSAEFSAPLHTNACVLFSPVFPPLPSVHTDIKPSWVLFGESTELNNDLQKTCFCPVSLPCHHAAGTASYQHDPKFKVLSYHLVMQIMQNMLILKCVNYYPSESMPVKIKVVEHISCSGNVWITQRTSISKTSQDFCQVSDFKGLVRETKCFWHDTTWWSSAVACYHPVLLSLNFKGVL